MKYANHCRKCGKRIHPGNLWCVDCRKKVDEELKGGKERPFDYYFRWWRWHKKDLWNWKKTKKEKDIFGQEGEFGAGKTLNRMLRGSK